MSSVELMGYAAPLPSLPRKRGRAREGRNIGPRQPILCDPSSVDCRLSSVYRSRHIAMPMPPPMQSVARPFLALRRCIS